MTREIVVDQVEGADWIRGVNGLQELEEASRVPGRSGEGERLPIRGT
jgi:hypothetical protein